MNGTDVRMIERGKNLRFATKARDPFGIVNERFRQDFQRDVAIESGIAGPIDFAHPPRPQGGKDFKRAEPAAWSKCQWERDYMTAGLFRLRHAQWTPVRVLEQRLRGAQRLRSTISGHRDREDQISGDGGSQPVWRADSKELSRPVRRDEGWQNK